MSMLTSCTFAVCVMAAAGLRAKKHNRTGTPGTIDSLWLYGGPEVGKPALTSFGGCFKGRHSVIVRSDALLGKQADLVSVIARGVGYRGAVMELEELDISKDAASRRGCTSEPVNKASGRGKWGLHDIPEYYRLLGETGTSGDNLAFGYFALFTAGIREASVAKVGVETHGWKLVASANHPGGGVIGGPQVSHLIQHPASLDCVVTFQFTMTIQDWWSNLNAISTPFCGLPGGQKVHRGLANALDLMVNSTEWQRDVRPNLPFCRKVISVGHSQGAAQAELFAACINQRPAPAGVPEYESMIWTPSKPKKLNYL